MKPSNNSTSVCPKAHRTTERTRSGLCKIKWCAWRGKGGPSIGYYSGATWEEAEAKERADAARRAIRYGEAHAGHAPIDKLGALLDYFEASGEFKKCSASMQRQRRYCIASMRADTLVTDRTRDKKCRLEDFPLAALGAKATRGIFKAWRDAQYEQRGPRASSFRVQTLKRALNVAKDSNFITTNPLDGFETPTGTERADLIWEDHHQAAYFGWIEAERLRVERGAETDKGMRQNAPKMLARLRAGELALRAALWIGLRREDISRCDHRWVQGEALVFLPGKGASRARTEGEKAEPCIVPILPQIRPEIDAMRERKGWLILSSRGSRYTAEALGAVVSEIATAAKVDRHLHDARGTFATYMMTTFPQLSDREVALMMDWSEADIARIRRIYVSGSKIAKAMIERINWNRQ